MLSLSSCRRKFNYLPSRLNILRTSACAHTYTHRDISHYANTEKWAWTGPVFSSFENRWGSNTSEISKLTRNMPNSCWPSSFIPKERLLLGHGCVQGTHDNVKPKPPHLVYSKQYNFERKPQQNKKIAFVFRRCRKDVSAELSSMSRIMWLKNTLETIKSEPNRSKHLPVKRSKSVQPPQRQKQFCLHQINTMGLLVLLDAA